MRSTILSCALLAATAFGTPIKRALVTELEIVTEYVTITVDPDAPVNTAAPVTTSSSSEEVVTVRVTQEVQPSAAPAPSSTSSPEPVPTPSPSPEPVPEPAPEPTPSPSPSPEPAPAPAPATEPEPTPEPAPSPEPTPTPAPSPDPAPAPKPAVFVAAPPSQGDGSPTSGSESVLATMNKWRNAYGLQSFKWDTVLASNAALTGQEGNGVNQIHSHLVANSAQNIAPGVDVAVGNPQGLTPFEVAQSAWLCEVSSDQPLRDAGVCKKLETISVGLPVTMTYSFPGITGHHDNFVNPDYDHAGCAYTSSSSPDSQSIWQGLWVCNYSKGSQS